MRLTVRLPFQYPLHQGVGKSATLFSGLLHFTLDMYLIVLSVKQVAFFRPLVWLHIPGHWQTLYSPGQWASTIIMNKISNKVIKFNKKTMKNLRVELTVGGKSLTEVKIQRGIFQEDAVSPLLFVIVVMPLNYILEEWTGGYKLHKFQEKISHLIYMADIKLFVKTAKDLETL